MGMTWEWVLEEKLKVNIFNGLSALLPLLMARSIIFSFLATPLLHIFACQRNIKTLLYERRFASQRIQITKGSFIHNSFFSWE